MKCDLLLPNLFCSELLSLVTYIGKDLVSNLPVHTTVENMVHRVLKIIRDEYVAGQNVSTEMNQGAQYFSWQCRRLLTY